MTQHETRLGKQAMEKGQEAAHPPRARQDKLINVVLVAVLIVTVSIFIISVLTIPVIASGSDAATATKDSTAVAACRSSFNVLVVDANNRLDDASRQVELLTNETLEGLLKHDQAIIDKNLPLIAPARDLVTERSVERDEATNRYRAAVKRSSDNPKAFLVECRDHPPI